MSTELIINATLPETRIALLENGEIQELHIERDAERGIVGNIYRGKVIRVLPGMQAAFVDIGLEKAAFLYVDDVYFPDLKTPLQTNPLPILSADVAARANVGLQLPSANQEGRPQFRGGRQQRYSKNQRGPRSEHNQNRNVPPAAPGTPEAHAFLQREYAKQMLNTDEAAEEQYEREYLERLASANENKISEQLAPTSAEVEQENVVQEPLPAQVPETAIEVHSSESENLPLNEVEARSPSLEDESSDLEAEFVHRGEPEIDPTAWVEDVVEIGHHGGDETKFDQPENSFESIEYNQETTQTEQMSAAISEQGQTQEDLSAGTSAEASSPDAILVEKPATPSLPKPLSIPAPLAKPIERAATPIHHDDRNEDEDDDDSEDESFIHRRKKRRAPVNIADIIKEGQEILVQVAKDPIGTKGARLTCHLSLPGRYLVFMPTVDHVGVSRRIESETERRRLKELISRVKPAKTGVIVRTASGNQTDQSLKADLDYLVTTWNEIQKKFLKQKTPSAVYQDLTIVLRAIRDMFTDEVDKVIVDSGREHKAIMKFVNRFIPQVKDKVELYSGDMPIFDAYGIETEISRAMERKVWLKSGGYLVVDQAEALVAIDVNTGRYVGKKTLEETILKTNLEAVKEIAYQIRLRNFGGIIILDLIDMDKDASKEKVYKALEEELRKDRARPTILKISQLGLIEMTRKRTRDSLVRSLCESCSYCEGRGFVRNKHTISFDIMRDVEREIMGNGVTGISIQCHPSVADALLEDKRDIIEDMERQYAKHITIRGNGAYHVEQYELVAHLQEKNLTWSSDERRQLVRTRIQERMQKINGENRKKADLEKAEKRRELLEKKKQQAMERKAASEEKRRLAAEKRKSQAASSEEGAALSENGDSAEVQVKTPKPPRAPMVIPAPLDKPIVKQAAPVQENSLDGVDGENKEDAEFAQPSVKAPVVASKPKPNYDEDDDGPQPMVDPMGRPLSGVGSYQAPFDTGLTLHTIASTPTKSRPQRDSGGQHSRNNNASLPRRKLSHGGQQTGGGQQQQGRRGELKRRDLRRNDRKPRPPMKAIDPSSLPQPLGSPVQNAATSSENNLPVDENLNQNINSESGSETPIAAQKAPVVLGIPLPNPNPLPLSEQKRPPRGKGKSRFSKRGSSAEKTETIADQDEDESFQATSTEDTEASFDDSSALIASGREDADESEE